MSRFPRLAVWCVFLLAVALIAQRPRIDAQQAPAPPVKVDATAPLPQGTVVPPGQRWTTSMTPNQEVPLPSGAPTGFGSGFVVLNAAETQITVFMTFANLTSNATMAHIHGDANSLAGVNGPIVFDLGATPLPSGTNFNSVFAITPAQVALLRGHRMYINVHSVNNPSGEIRGQLHLLEMGFNADGDGKTDAAVFRPSETNWYLRNSSTNTMTVFQWGAGPDLFVPGDYDGDGRLDAAIWRPTSGSWFIRQSSNGAMVVHAWGASSDIPVPADYDKDGRTDPAVFRPATGQWYLLRSTAGPIGFTFGTMGDRPVAGDFDGDGRADLAVKRPGSNWYVFTAAGGVLTFTLNEGDTPLVPGDFTGDGKTDVGQFNPASGLWNFMDGSNGSPFLYGWGGPGDLPVPGDYDSDGKMDVAVFRPASGFWFVRQSYGGVMGSMQWGAPDDGPLPAMFSMPSVVPTAVGDTATVDEDTGATAIDALANDTDPDGGLKRIFSATPPAYGAVAITGIGTGLTYQPNPDYCGPDAFTYTLLPGGSTATVTVTVTCIDDAPLAVSDSATVNEDSAANPINVLANDTDIDSGPRSITSVTQPTNGVVVITGGGTELTYLPNADYCNAPPPGPTDTFTYTLTPGNNAATVSVTVLCVNDAPVATDEALSSIAEDSAPRIIPFATLLANDSAGPPSEAGQTLAIVSVSSAVGGTVIIVATDVVFTPTANYNGPVSLGYTVADNGETGGVPDPQTDTGAVTFTITEVNDAPVATDDPLSSVLEDSAPRSISLASILANDTVGPANEGADQSLTVTGVSNAVGGTAVLSGANVMFTLTPNFFGTASFDYTIQDNGTTNGAPDALTDVGHVTFTVTPVNDAPSFLIPANPPPVNEDAGPQTIANFATSISPGPNETGQVLTFVIVSNSIPTLFSAGPSISATGTLTYTPALNQNGVANIQVRLDDDGGTANGGDNQSDPISFSITVNAVNDAPVASNKIGSAQANMQVSIPNLLVGVTDADTGVNGCAPTFTLASAGPTTSPLGGSVAITNAATGTVDFNPPPGVTGLVTFTYTVSDNGCPGTATSAAATVSVTVNGPVIWFVNSGAPAGGDGRLTNPFNTLAGADAVDAAGHRIFLYTGTYTTGLTMQFTEWLIGQGATGADFDTLMGITPPSGTVARPTINGTRPTVQGTVTLNGSTRVQGLNIAPGAGITGLNDPAGAIASVTVSEANVTTTNAPAVNLSDLGGALSFTSVTSTGGANVGISLINQTGSFTVTGGAAAGSGGTIANKTGADGSTTSGIGVFLSNASSVSLNRMQLNDFQNYAIRGVNVNGFTLANTVINGANGTNPAGPFYEGSVVFDGTGASPAQGVVGTASITSSDIRGGRSDNLRIDNSAGTLNLTISGTTFRDTFDAADASDNILIELDTTATAFVSVTGSTFGETSGDHIQASLLNAAVGHFTITNNTMTGTGSAKATRLGMGILIFGGTWDGSAFYNISNNTMSGTRQGGAIHTNKGSGSGNMQGTISGNNIGVAGVAESGASESSGITVASRGVGGVHTALVSNNIIHGHDEFGINLELGEDGGVASNSDPAAIGPASALNVTVTGNTVGTAGPNALHGIHVNTGIQLGDNNTASLDIGGAGVLANNVTAGANEVNGGSDIRVRQRMAARVQLLGYGGTAFDNAAVQTYMTGRNNLTSVSATSNNATATANDGFFNVASVPQPTPPILP